MEHEDTRIVLYLDGREIIIDIAEYIPVGGDVGIEFRDQASKYAYIAMLAAEAEAAWLESKTQLKRTYAKTDQNVRKDMVSAGGRITEAMVSAEVELTPDYVEDKDEEQYYHRQFLVMRAIETSMKMRADMLVSLGAQLRNEANQLGMITKKKVRDIQHGRG